MDEADVLGDRIAIVKEGRMRALGTSKFLKVRFGLGYLIRNSLKQNVDINPIVALIQSHVESAQVVSNAGTELAIRLPKEAVSRFANLMEALENKSRELGVLSFGIETTTLEEVFMRIVNEDTETMMSNPEEASRMLGASGIERKQYEERVKERDNKRNPLTDAQLQLLLKKGRKQEGATGAQSVGPAGHRNTLSAADAGSGSSGGWAVFQTQLRVLLWKRRHQVDRSRGQWAFTILLPIAIVILLAVVVQKVPTNVVNGNPGATDISSYTPYVSTPVAGYNATDAMKFATSAGIDDAVYTGTDYQSLYNYIYAQSNHQSTHNNSLEGVYFFSQSNFSVMYNASYPMQLPAIITALFDSYVNNVTGSKLTIATECEPLPSSAINAQTNFGIMFCFLIALLAGSLGGGMSIVLSGERVGLVKHQQLASGTGKLTYWTANFLFDFTVMLFHLFVFIVAMACADSTDYGGDNAGDILACGLIFIVAALFRFYVISFMVDDVKLVQSVYFYGSLMLMYAISVAWLEVVFQGYNGNIGASGSKFMTVILSIVDPNFGFAAFVLFKRNFLGATSMHHGIEWIVVPGIIISFLISFLLFLVIECGNDIEAVMSYMWHSLFGGERQQDGPTPASPCSRETPMRMIWSSAMTRGLRLGGR